MTIAFEINFKRNNDNSLQDFLLNLFSFYSEKYPNTNFLLISNNREILQKNVLPNQKFITYSSGIWGSIKSFFVKEFLLGLLLKKRKVNILICDNFDKRKNKLDITTFNWINDLSAIKKIPILSEKRHLFCTNDFIRNQIVITDSKNEVFVHLSNFTTIENIRPTTFEQKENSKQYFSAGKEYFLFYSDRWTKKEEFIAVMKAFSLFKKWQKSNMQLVLILDRSIEDELMKLIESYKFKEDLKIIFNEDGQQILELLSACYGCIMSVNSSVQSKMINAVKLNIPMVVDDSDFNKSGFANACVYAKMDEIQISQKMILLYKDEHFREQIINETILLSEKLNWDFISVQIWQTISK